MQLCSFVRGLRVPLKNLNYYSTSRAKMQELFEKNDKEFLRASETSQGGLGLQFCVLATMFRTVPLDAANPRANEVVGAKDVVRFFGKREK